MIESFGNDGSRDIFHGNNSKKARNTLPKNAWDRARDKLDVINRAESVEDLRVLPGTRLEKLEGYENRWSVRINDQYRILFDWIEGEALNVTITDYH